ncbi:MAG TPA: hypothetical protein EYN91_07235 [Candidatus Melainabacteria bacterium]|jgi:hypothetical protein|nr:hypothetical protein [Candidatus Melainabacteria bacterium]HIN65134.1 hypothetical protein [Candidatus Obscuribacterales bacterium]
MYSDHKRIKQASLLGQVLTTAGIVDVEVVSETYSSSDRDAEEMGRMLLHGGFLADADLRAAMEAVKEVESGNLTPDQAAYALKFAYDNCLPFPAALESTIMQAISVVNPNLLGELFLAAHLVSEFQLAVAMDQARDCGLTLGRVLLLTQIITVPILEAAVELLRMVRDQQLFLNSAADALRLVAFEKSTLEEALKSVGMENQPEETRPKLGALLTGAGLIADFDAINAAEVGLETCKPIGQVFHECGLVTALVLRAALKLQQMIESALVSVQQAFELLRQVHNLQLPLEDLMKELGQLKAKMLSLLMQSGAVTQDEVSTAAGFYSGEATDVLTALVQSQTLTPQLMRDTARCVSLIESGKVKWELATMAILYCRRTGSDLQDALSSVQAESAQRLRVLGLSPAMAG